MTTRRQNITSAAAPQANRQTRATPRRRASQRLLAATMLALISASPAHAASEQQDLVQHLLIQSGQTRLLAHSLKAGAAKTPYTPDDGEFTQCLSARLDDTHLSDLLAPLLLTTLQRTDLRQAAAFFDTRTGIEIHDQIAAGHTGLATGLLNDAIQQQIPGAREAQAYYTSAQTDLKTEPITNTLIDYSATAYLDDCQSDLETALVSHLETSPVTGALGGNGERN